MAKRKNKMRFLVPTKAPLSKRRTGKRKKGITWKSVGRILLFAILALIFFTALVFAWFSKDLPTPGNIKKRTAVQSSQVLDREGNVLYQISGEERRTVIKSEDIPQYAKDAVVALEDKDFYKHHGVDFRGIIRSIYYNFIKRDPTGQGGSTITQQFVKNALLSPKKTYTRKIKEIILSIEIEMMYSKDEILTMYLNEIPYGSNAYGIQAASETYFDKNAKDLTLTEAAILASLPQAPTYYSPYGSHRDALYYRALHTLKEMRDQGYITEDERALAAAPIENKQVAFSKFKANIKAPHFVFYVREKMAAKYGDRLLEEGGLQITTTLDPNKQAIAEEVVAAGASKNWSRYRGYNAALVAIDPKNGEVLAMVGGRDYFDTEHDGNVNVAARPRQPGSAFKPVVYATLFKEQWGPGSTLYDLSTDFGNGYEPQNNDGRTQGPLTIRDALGSSLNIPAVKALGIAGLNNVLATAKDMGVTTLNEPERYGLSLVLGGGEVKLVELTGAYAVFADNGKAQETTEILKVVDSTGKVLEDNTPEGRKKEQVIHEDIAYEISNVLSDNNAKIRGYGSYRSIFSNPNHLYAVKTGTTTDFRDGWTLGYTPSLVAGVWTGNNDNTAMASGAYGSMTATPIWRDFMDRALEGTPNEEFSRPEEIKEATIDKLTNKLASSGSKMTTTDIFAPWQIPSDKNGSVTVRIDKITGKKATDDCPAEFVEERTFYDIHSEKPDNPNWENPVRAWAAASGYLNPPPSGEATCAAKDATNQPRVTISSPSDGSEVSGTRTISTSINAPLGIKLVEFYIDDVNIGTDTSSPYSYSYNFNNLSLGSHKIKVRVIDRINQSADTTINVQVVDDSTPPAEVENLISAQGSGSISLSWSNPGDSDFSHVRIYRSDNPGSIGILIRNNYTATSFSESRPPGEWWYTIKTVDYSGNPSNGRKIKATSI